MTACHDGAESFLPRRPALSRDDTTSDDTTTSDGTGNEREENSDVRHVISEAAASGRKTVARRRHHDAAGITLTTRSREIEPCHTQSRLHHAAQVRPIFSGLFARRYHSFELASTPDVHIDAVFLELARRIFAYDGDLLSLQR